MEKWIDKVAVVTGASTGIGAQIATSLVKHGMKVVGCARNLERLQDLAKTMKGEKGTLLPLKCDVRQESDVISVFEKACQEFGGVDVCINNAGLTLAAPILDGNVEQWREIMEVNILGLTICTKEASKCFNKTETKRGHIININAGFGHFVTKLPNLSFYSATKYAVTALTEATRNELRAKGSKVKVTDISPWMTESEFLPRMMNMTPDQGREFYSQHPCLKAEDIADTVVYVLSAPEHVQVRDLYVCHTDND